MPGENEKAVSQWTTDTIKYHFDQRFVDQEKAVQAALTAAKEATLKAELASDKRFDAANEFRAQLTDQTATFIPRQEFVVQHKALTDRITELTDRLNRNEGVAKGSELTMGKLYAAIGAATALLGLVVLLANGVFKG